MKRFATHLVAGACAAVILAACGGGGGDEQRTVAAANTTATINASTGATLVQAVSAQTLTFSNGVPAFGTNAATDVKLTAGASPTFNITSGGLSASGELGFGSCKFKITASTFTSGPLQVGQTIVVEPCQISVATANQTATGNPVDTDVSLVLGSTTSTPKKLPIVIAPSGAVTFVTSSGTAIPLGSVSVSVVTGAS